MVQSKLQRKPESKTDGKTEHKTEHKTDGKTDHKTDGKTDHKTDGKTDHKTDGKTDHKTKHKTGRKIVFKTERKTGSKAGDKKEPKPKNKLESKIYSKPEIKIYNKPLRKTDSKVDTKMEQKTERKTESSSKPIPSHKYGHKTMTELVKKYAFNSKEIEVILYLYRKSVSTLTHGKEGFMTKNEALSIFPELFEIFDLEIVQNIYQVVDSESRNYITPEDWTRLLQVFIRGNNEEKMEFCYKVYKETNPFNRDLIKKWVRKMLNTGAEETTLELTNYMVDIIYDLFDKNRDGIISYEEYSEVVRKKPGLMECLGPCLPSEWSIGLLDYVIRADVE